MRRSGFTVVKGTMITRECPMDFFLQPSRQAALNQNQLANNATSNHGVINHGTEPASQTLNASPSSAPPARTTYDKLKL